MKNRFVHSFTLAELLYRWHVKEFLSSVFKSIRVSQPENTGPQVVIAHRTGSTNPVESRRESRREVEMYTTRMICWRTGNSCPSPGRPFARRQGSGGIELVAGIHREIEARDHMSGV